MHILCKLFHTRQTFSYRLLNDGQGTLKFIVPVAASQRFMDARGKEENVQLIRTYTYTLIRTLSYILNQLGRLINLYKDMTPNKA